MSFNVFRTRDASVSEPRTASTERGACLNVVRFSFSGVFSTNAAESALVLVCCSEAVVDLSGTFLWIGSSLSQKRTGASSSALS